MMAAGNDCPALLPADAEAIGELRLCRVSVVGNDGFSACREYSNEQRLYQLVFRGGTAPVAVLERSAVNDAFLNGPGDARHARTCDLKRPAGVPAEAVYRGTGVCRDERERPLPCSLYEHAAARTPEALRYFVYYEPDGGGVRRVDAVPAGRNERALEAEFSYQFGRALMDSDCCRDEARGYLTHAAVLFPRDAVYARALGELAARAPEIDCGPESGVVLTSGYRNKQEK
jgi:hypothetical protein